MTAALRHHSSDGVMTETPASGTLASEPGARSESRSAALDIDRALQLMAPEIAEWLEINTQRLQDALALHLSLGGSPPRTLMHLVTNLRGQIGGIGFPMASRVAAALYRLLEADRPAPADVIVAHVDAIRAIILENARGTGNPLASALVEALEEFGNIWIAPTAGNYSESSLGS